MLSKMFMYGVVFTCGFLALAGLHHSGSRCPAARILALACASAAADDAQDDKDKPALSGVWLQNKGEMKIEFAGKDKLKFLPHGGNDCIIVCQYTVDKKGLVKAKITELESNAKEELEKILSVGLEFSFRWTVKDDTGTLEEVKGEVEKSHLEGKYRQKK